MKVLSIKTIIIVSLFGASGHAMNLCTLLSTNTLSADGGRVITFEVVCTNSADSQTFTPLTFGPNVGASTINKDLSVARMNITKEYLERNYKLEQEFFVK